MNLIIDIPEEDYKFIKDLQSLIIGGRGSCKTIQMNVINAIRNGIPYNLKSDLISREALKKAITQSREIDSNAVCDVLDIIDNAPTVSDRYGEGYAQGYIDGSTGADWKGGAE